MAGLTVHAPWRNGASRDPLALARELFALEPFARQPGGGFNPHFNVVESEDRYVLTADLPGVAERDVAVTLENRVLEIKGSRAALETKDTDNVHLVERRSGSFSRSFKLPTQAASDGVTANLANGVLTVTVPKRPEIAPRTIEIKTS